ncbi:hypothetical protein SGPA1_12621 [Streptomyces misionensis JCM 4497]
MARCHPAAAGPGPARGRGGVRHAGAHRGERRGAARRAGGATAQGAEAAGRLPVQVGRRLGRRQGQGRRGRPARGTAPGLRGPAGLAHGAGPRAGRSAVHHLQRRHPARDRLPDAAFHPGTGHGQRGRREEAGDVRRGGPRRAGLPGRPRRTRRRIGPRRGTAGRRLAGPGGRAGLLGVTASPPAPSVPTTPRRRAPAPVPLRGRALGVPTTPSTCSPRGPASRRASTTP